MLSRYFSLSSNPRLSTAITIFVRDHPITTTVPVVLCDPYCAPTLQARAKSINTKSLIATLSCHPAGPGGARERGCFLADEDLLGHCVGHSDSNHRTD